MYSETQYELINKARGEVMKVTGMEFGDEEVIVTSGDVTVKFLNPDLKGNLVAEDGGWAIRRADSSLKPNGEEVTVEDSTTEEPVKKKSRAKNN